MQTINTSSFTSEVPNHIFIYRERHSGFRAPHRHDFTEIGFVLEGQGTHLTAIGNYSLVPGDAFIVTPSAWHGLADAEALRIHFCCFSPMVVQRELSMLMADATIRHLLVEGPRKRLGIGAMHLSSASLAYCLHQTEAIWNTGIALESDGNACALSAKNPILSYARQVAHLTLLLTCLAEQYVTQFDYDKGKGGDSRIQSIAERVEANPGHEWTVPKMAEIACLEPSYFIRRFHKELGISPMRFLYHARMRLASEKLLAAGDSLQEIASACGYSESAHFITRFRQYFNVTPAVYRQQNRY